MQQGICNPEFYGDLVYKFKKIIGNPKLEIQTWKSKIGNSKFQNPNFDRPGISIRHVAHCVCRVLVFASS